MTSMTLNRTAYEAIADGLSFDGQTVTIAGTEIPLERVVSAKAHADSGMRPKMWAEVYTTDGATYHVDFARGFVKQASELGKLVGQIVKAVEARQAELNPDVVGTVVTWGSRGPAVKRHDGVHLARRRKDGTLKVSAGTTFDKIAATFVPDEV